MRIRGRAVVLTVALAAAVQVAMPSAFADHGSITDPTGDTHHAPVPHADYDIVRAGWGHTDSGLLEHWVAVDGTIGHPRTGMGPIPRLLIDVPGEVDTNPSCDYFISPLPPHVADNTTDHWKYFVERCSNSQPTVIGPAHASRPNSHRIVITFAKGRIGNPAHYGWAADLPSDGDAPPYDRAPNSGFHRHDLS